MFVENGVERMPNDPPDFIHMFDFDNRPKRFKIESVGDKEWCVMGDDGRALSLYWFYHEPIQENVRRTGFSSDARVWRLFKTKKQAEVSLKRCLGKTRANGAYLIAQPNGSMWSGKRFSLADAPRIYRARGVASIVISKQNLLGEIYKIDESGQIVPAPPESTPQASGNYSKTSTGRERSNKRKPANNSLFGVTVPEPEPRRYQKDEARATTAPDEFGVVVKGDLTRLLDDYADTRVRERMSKINTMLGEIDDHVLNINRLMDDIKKEMAR